MAETSIVKIQAAYRINFESGTERVAIEVGEQPDQFFIVQGTDMVLLRRADIEHVIAALNMAMNETLEDR